MKTTFTSRLLSGALLLLALTGCKQSEDKPLAVTSSATPTVVSDKSTGGDKASAKVEKPPVKADNTPPKGDKAPVKAGKTPASIKGKTPDKMTPSQIMGIDILKALNADASMRGHTISVGTTSDTVILNGKVKSAAQKKTAETIAHKKAPKAKIINKTEVNAK